MGATSEVSFTAGLLHDIGRIAISACFPEKWADILKYAEEKDTATRPIHGIIIVST
ncbi:MAG: HDOD domain-containing protein [Deltaproteobacteria bacterium]|nr:HDOD domain-containing protein [Deltaproteobacteria bacterium]